MKGEGKGMKEHLLAALVRNMEEEERVEGGELDEPERRRECAEMASRLSEEVEKHAKVLNGC